MYRLLPDQASGIVRAADGAAIPADPANADWQAYQKWLAAGGVPDAAVPVARPALDDAIRSACAAGIARGFAAPDGRSMRGSMNLWLGSVLVRKASGAAAQDGDDTCLAMAPKLNDWEGAMFIERDRLLAAGLTAADAAWPAPPEGAAAFVLSCDQG